MSLMTKAKELRHKAYMECSRSFFGVVGHSDFKRFIVLTRSRTGSNMLISFLDSHPNIWAEGEIVNRLDGRDPVRAIKRAFARQSKKIRAKGFKIFYYHPLDDQSGRIWEELVGMDGLCVIQLKRRNILRTGISRKIAGMQDVWRVETSSSPVSDADKSVTFTFEELEKIFLQTREMERRGEEMFEGNPMLPVYYEDLVSDPQGAFRSITDFLGVDYIAPKTRLRTQNPESMRDLVSNYDELKREFTGTQWQGFFED